MTKLKNLAQFLIALLMLIGLVLGIWWMLQALWSGLSVLDKTVLAAMVTGTLVASGAIWVKHVENRHSVEAQFRDAKVELFNEFMGAFDRISTNDITTEQLLPLLREWRRKLLFWGGPKVMRGFLSLRELGGDNRTIGDMAQRLGTMGDLILAMRKDVGLSNRGIVTGSTKGVSKGTIMGARYLLRHPDLFLGLLKKDPSLPLEQVTALEALMDKNSGLSS